jgi:hypothetical protein
MKYEGSCHCGAIRFEVEGTIDRAMECNCSICSRKGSLLWFTPRDTFRLLTPEDNARTYTFNRHVIQHRFCPTCGIHPYALASDRSGNPMAAVNIRCIEGLDLGTVKISPFDGRSL